MKMNHLSFDRKCTNKSEFYVIVGNCTDLISQHTSETGALAAMKGISANETMWARIEIVAPGQTVRINDLQKTIHEPQAKPEFDAFNLDNYTDTAELLSYKAAGRWWADTSIELVEIDDVVYALSGWNGEKYLKSWACSGEGNTEPSNETYAITPEFTTRDDDTMYYETKGFYVTKS